MTVTPTSVAVKLRSPHSIRAFGADRNSVAHRDLDDVIDKAIRNLGTKTYQIGLPVEPDTNLGVLAMNLATALHVGTEFYECVYGDRSVPGT